MTNLTTDNVAIFLDFDGTLVDFAPSPDAVEVSEQLVQDLKALSRQLQGAIAIVTGREYSILSALLDVSHMICACEHGSDIVVPPEKNQTPHTLAEQMDAESSPLSSEQQVDVRETVNRYANEKVLRSEAKRTSVTLHYRTKPELEGEVLGFAESLCQQFPGMELLKGKCVVEFRFTAKNKGTAIQTLMSAFPFNGRTPIFIGDDVTDEFGFKLVNELQGISIKVGEGDTCASHQMDSVQDVQKFLSAIVQTGDVTL